MTVTFSHKRINMMGKLFLLLNLNQHFADHEKLSLPAPGVTAFNCMRSRGARTAGRLP